MKELDQLIENLRYLMDRSGLDTQGRLHRASGISQAHIGNILRGEKSPSLQIIEQLAETFGLRAWQLLAPLHILKLGISPDLAKIIDCYANSDNLGKQTILRVAETQSIVPTKD